MIFDAINASSDYDTLIVHVNDGVLSIKCPSYKMYFTMSSFKSKLQDIKIKRPHSKVHYSLCRHQSKSKNDTHVPVYAWIAYTYTLECVKTKISILQQ